jgi:biopolymer transport protein ExbB/TolQ
MQDQEKKLGIGGKLILLFGFLAVWLGLSVVLWNMGGAEAAARAKLDSAAAAKLGMGLTERFHEGGWGMIPILAVGIVFILITIERARYLFGVVKGRRQAIAAHVQRYLLDGDVQGAVSFCQQSSQPLAKIVGQGLAHLHRPNDEVQEAVDDAALSQLPKIEARTGYLAMIGNIATLLGLLGTIVGLITSFAGVSLQDTNDPKTIARAANYVHLVPQCRGQVGKALVTCIDANKATILAKGISEAMNCTAFGLLVGIMALLAFSVLNGRTQRLIDDISDGAVQLMNLAASHRRAMRLAAGSTPGDAATGTAAR